MTDETRTARPSGFGPSGSGTWPHGSAAAEDVVRAGVEAWVRERMLPRLVPIGPDEIADVSRSGRLAVLRRLIGALRGERARGRSGHWSYSLDRHIGLMQAVAAERQAFTRATGERFTLARHRSAPARAQNETAANPGARGGE